MDDIESLLQDELGEDPDVAYGDMLSKLDKEKLMKSDPNVRN